MLERYPQVVRWTRASGTTCGKGEVPSLAKEGWPRHQVNGPIPLKARPGWFVQLPIIGGLNQPPRLRPLRRLRGIFLMGAATPPCARRGLRLSLQLSSMPPCPAKDVGHSKAVVQGGNNALSQLIHTFGVVRSREIVLEFERTTPSAPFKGTGIFLDGAATPPLPRRGVFASYRFVPKDAVSPQATPARAGCKP